MTLIVICVLAALLLPPCAPVAAAFAQTGLASDLAGAHDGTYARSIGTESSGEVLRGGVTRNARWLDGRRGRAVRVRIGAISQGDAGRNHAGATGDRADVLCCAMAAGRHTRASIWELRCVRELSAMLTGPTRVLASFLLSHSAIQAVERVRAYRHALSTEDGARVGWWVRIIGLDVEKMSFHCTTTVTVSSMRSAFHSRR